MSKDKWGSLKIMVLCALAMLFLSCAEEVQEKNVYKQRTIITQGTLFKFIEDLIKTAEPRLKTEDNRFVLYLGDNVWRDDIDNQKEMQILAKFFEYDPNDRHYIIEYRKAGVYGGTYAMKKIEYYPDEFTLKKSRYKSKVNLNETWTCMTYDDVLYTAKTGYFETDCYSHR